MSWLNQNIAAVYSVISLGIAVAIYFAFKFKIDFLWLNFWYSLPVIGKLARLSQDSTRLSSDQSWTNAERTLCHDYKQFIHLTTPHEFRQQLNYLRKAQDNGRTPLAGWLTLLLAVLVVAEGLGFSYLLGTWMAMEGSPDVQKLLMLAIVFVLCVILLYITHSAGHQLYRTGLVRLCEKEWRDDGQPSDFKSDNVILDDDQSIDDKQPKYTQCVNRVGTGGNYFWIIAATILIVLIAVGSTQMRIKHLAGELTQETTQMATPFLSSGGVIMPGAVSKPQVEAENKGTADANSDRKDEGLAAFLMLAVIFIATQVVAISAGYNYGFAGKESTSAYKNTYGFSTYDSYIRFCEPFIQVARSKLQTLQQRLMERQSNKNLRLTHTLNDYLTEEQRVSFGRTQDYGQATIQKQPKLSQSTPELGTDNLHARYIAIPHADRDGRLKFIKSIQPDSLKEQFKQQLRDKKEADTKRTAELEDRELEDLV
jgi:hypothetical protein